MSAVINAQAAPYNVVASGTVNDADRIDAAIAAGVSAGVPVNLGAGVFGINRPLAPIVGSSINIFGAGQCAASFRYLGVTQPGHLITIGDGVNLYEGVRLSGFSLSSLTTLTAGTAIRIRKSVTVEIDLDFNGGGKLWDGLWCDGTSTINLNHSRFYTRNRGVIANDGSELHLNQAWIGGQVVGGYGTGIGVHIAGGFGGVWTEGVKQQNNDTGLLVDRSISSAGNNQFFLSGAFDTNKTAAAVFDDTVNNPIGKSIDTTGFTASSSSMGHGVWLKNWAGGSLRVPGGKFSNHSGSGLKLDDPTSRVAIGRACDASSNGGYGVAAAAPIAIKGPTAPDWINNVSGNYQSTVTPT